MAATQYPVTDERRPNIPSAAVRLPAVRDYEQVDREIIGDAAPDRSDGSRRSGSRCSASSSASRRGCTRSTAGLGVAGYSPPVMWGVYIITFVFWVGIGHAGTLISAILYLFRAGFRTSIYRCAEAMTVFAVMTAALFPILHLGRPWKFFWLIPYPNWRLIWPQFKSPLVWDVFAILTYFTVSSTFLYIGLIPDIAVLRDRETNPVRKRIFSMLSLGWRNSDREWRHFTRAYLFLAAFSTPLVLSVHSVVSFDFAMALDARMARHDLPAVLRRRRDLLRARHGVHDRHPDPEVLQAQALRHAQRSRRRGEDDVCSRRSSSDSRISPSSRSPG